MELPLVMHPIVKYGLYYIFWSTEYFSHPAYSLDLATSGFFLFPLLKAEGNIRITRKWGKMYEVFGTIFNGTLWNNYETSTFIGQICKVVYQFWKLKKNYRILIVFLGML